MHNNISCLRSRDLSYALQSKCTSRARRFQAGSREINNAADQIGSFQSSGSQRVANATATQSPANIPPNTPGAARGSHERHD